MDLTNDTINIVCGIDTAYAPHLAVMLRSMMVTNRDEDIRVYVLHDSINAALRARVDACVPQIPIEWIEISNHRVLGFDNVKYLTRSTYFRLIMLEVLDPKIKRVLYFDADIIINGKLRPLWQTDLDDKHCAAVIDTGVKGDDFATKWSLPTGQYFNAGVMLFELDRLREIPYFQRAIEILEKPNNQCEYADQCALNVVFWNQWKPLDPGWNFQRGFYYDNFTLWKAYTPKNPEPLIIHFTQSIKPWRREEWHPYAWLYIRNLLHTPFWRQVLRDGDIDFVRCCKFWLRYLRRNPLAANDDTSVDSRRSGQS